MSECIHLKGATDLLTEIVGDGYGIFCEGPRSDEFCSYCNCVHPFVNFGDDLQGNPTLVCVDQLHANAHQPWAGDYGSLDDDILS
jgi:hypothetical protein